MTKGRIGASHEVHAWFGNRLTASGCLLAVTLVACGKEGQRQPDSAIAMNAGLPPATATSCPNLAGNYGITGEDGSVTVILRQGGCRTAHVEWNIDNYDFKSSTPHDFIVDGVARPDSAWFNEKEMLSTSARYVADTLVLESRQPGVPESTGRTVRKFYGAPEGLCAAYIRARDTSVSYARRDGSPPLDERDSTLRCSVLPR
jgi:hypothetical protein